VTSDAVFLAGVALIVALIGTESALITTVLVNRRERETGRQEREELHKERLRSLYSDVMLAALRLMPEAFPVRLGSGVDLTTKDQIDVLGARLRLEKWREGDHILEELIEVWRAANEWHDHKDDPERAKDLVDPLRRRVMKSLEGLEDAMRANLGTSPQRGR
jgi:hypothetical protein